MKDTPKGRGWHHRSGCRLFAGFLVSLLCGGAFFGGCPGCGCRLEDSERFEQVEGGK